MMDATQRTLIMMEAHFFKKNEALLRSDQPAEYLLLPDGITYSCRILPIIGRTYLGTYRRRSKI